MACCYVDAPERLCDIKDFFVNIAPYHQPDAVEPDRYFSANKKNSVNFPLVEKMRVMSLLFPRQGTLAVPTTKGFWQEDDEEIPYLKNFVKTFDDQHILRPGNNPIEILFLTFGLGVFAVGISAWDRFSGM